MSRKSSRESIPKGLRGAALVARSLVVFSEPLRPKTLGLFDGFPLTATEREVVEAVLEGESTRSIAEMRKVSEGTIRKQLGSIYRKLRVSGRQELLVLASPSQRTNDPTS